MPRKAKTTPTTGDGESPQGLTDNELRFIKAVFDNMTQKPDANWDSVATDLGLKDAKCAKERFRQMSVRHGWRDQTAPGAGSPRKGAKNGATGPSGDGKVTKRAPKTPTKKAKKEDEDAVDDDDVDLIGHGDGGYDEDVEEDEDEEI